MNLFGLDYGLLFIFKICVEQKSFSKASKILNVKQPAVSYSIKKLEELLDTQLFERGNYGINITEEGKILYDYINEANNNILSGLNIIDELKNKEIKSLKIGVPAWIASVFLIPTLKEFKKVFPNVEITIISNPEKIMLNDLKEKKLDVVVFNTSKNNIIPGIKIKKIRNNDIVLVGNKEYKELFEQGNEENISNIPIISPDSNTNLGKLVNMNISIESKKTNIFCQSSIIAKELIVAGLGIGFINKQMINKELKEKKLFIICNDSNVCNNYSIDIATQDKNLNIVIKEFEKIFIKCVVSECEKY